MTTTTRGDRSRVRSFDHGSFGAWPEYVAAQQALDALAHALAAHGQQPATRQGWLDLVADMASVLPFSDACPGEHAVDDPSWLAAPWKVDREGEWLRCQYHCPTHRTAWSCGYSVATLELM